MKNFIQTGDSITVTAPINVVSGQGVLIGSLFGVAATTAATGDDVALSCRGVFALPAADLLAVGDPVEWDAANSQVAALDAGNQVGVVVGTAGPSAVAVRLI